ncbi:hypothetical protein M426DRAFT_199271 [Hypoxylon sp. CI-4A]|nr:hypothetical protein M426DRAFT_199271 [Hypoxylon sp. CI-4A]
MALKVVGILNSLRTPVLGLCLNTPRLDSALGRTCHISAILELVLFWKKGTGHTVLITYYITYLLLLILNSFSKPRLSVHSLRTAPSCAPLVKTPRSPIIRVQTKPSLD